MAIDLNKIVSGIKQATDTAKQLKTSVTPIISVLKPSVNTAKPPVVNATASGGITVSGLNGGSSIAIPQVTPSQTIPATNNKMWYIIGGVTIVVIIGLIVYLKK